MGSIIWRKVFSDGCLPERSWARQTLACLGKEISDASMRGGAEFRMGLGERLFRAAAVTFVWMFLMSVAMGRVGEVSVSSFE